MSKRDYEALAATLGRAVAVEASEGGGEGSRAAGAAYRVALAVADTLADTSPRYDGVRFLDAVERVARATTLLLTGEPYDATRGAGYCIANALSFRKGSRY